MTNCDRNGKGGQVYDCLLFDLDGTLVDSRADLAAAVNLMLEELGEPVLSEAAVIGFVGEGARLLVERSLLAAAGRAIAGQEPAEEAVERALEIFMRHYRNHLLDRTVLYPGVGEALAQLAQLPLGVITNKPYEFAVTMLKRLGLDHYFRIVLGGDSMPERKPSPMMLLEAARACGVDPARTLMIGDSRIDIAAGRNAGMKTCGFTGGFRGRDELRQAGADLLFDHFAELPQLVLPD
ncbi:MAG: hypothetical protein RIR86_1625 [Acidobacteriota bacterium]|jgi:phosphoglycolate phosphatase